MRRARVGEQAEPAESAAPWEVGGGPTALIIVGGGPGTVARVPPVDARTLVVAADSGLDVARAAGLHVDHAVGDFDSASPDAVALAEVAGTSVHRHAADKDATDLELALDLVVALLAARLSTASPVVRPVLVVVGGGGGRLDHLLADVAALAGPALAHVDVWARLGPADLAVVRPDRPVTIGGGAGRQVSLLPAHGAAEGVTTTGLRWPLVGAHLAPGTTRAVSNELVGGPATVAVTAGILVVVQPGTVAEPIEPRTTRYDPTIAESEGG